ncbi:PE-PPE domain-containing protein [Mycolicibacter heraklionensis]|uniref:PE-PPE domain-containing protein n=1 Tax=Mycolicibacter heraklionensis TaxID=512402 RepID=A0AA91IZ47_9MYCO|nr:PE-PPE domain-containing protein [Mycolicibacter heraklionensis]OBK87404.1 PE-PPE domain-containing protein [Mycolicibacter heraklionensis]
MTTLSHRNLSSIGAVPLTLAAIAALGVAPVVSPALAATAKSVVAETTLLDTESWIMGGSGLPIPPPQYLAALSERFISPVTPKFDGQPTFHVDATNPLFTPEGLYPLTGVKTLPLDTSLQQGSTILFQKIMEETGKGNDLVVLGYSQSSVINGLVMDQLLALPEDERPTSDELSFVSLGSPANPNGGLLSRFDVPGVPLSMPALGVTFSGGAPSETPWETVNYIREYDGFADFPKYPLNFLADINAFLGIMFVHGGYPSLTDAQLATAIELDTSGDYTGNNQYFMIPTENLPLLELLRGNAFGNAFADLLQPALRVLINLGYGNIEHGWDQGPADVSTPFGVFPDVNPMDVLTALANGAEQGWNDFIADLQNIGSGSATDLFGLDGGGPADFSLPSLMDVVNTLTSAAASLYATLLPTADIINSLVTTLPAYTASLFFNELMQGDLLGAIGMPLAATTGLVTMAGGFEFMVMSSALSSISADFADLFS